MKITNNLHSQSFKARPIYEVKIKERNAAGEFEPQKAYFCELSPKCKQDVDVIKKVQENWATQEAQDMAEVFFEKGNITNFHAIIKAQSEKEIQNEKNLFKRLKSLSESTAVLSEYKMLNLSSSPDIVNKAAAKTKGAGELCVYGTLKLAREKGLSSFSLYAGSSLSEDFYKKIGLKKSGQPQNEPVYKLQGKGIDTFLRRVEKKYGF